MKKKDLITIVRKIQNRCCLEEPEKITYYRNEDGDVVFKAFFESLYLPENLRIGDKDIQNMFSVPDVYEYEDDFKILEFNQDEGFIKFVPDNQHFKVVDSYKEANTKEDSFTESLVHLAGKRLNEDFARNKDYILREAEDISNTELQSLDLAKAAAQSGGKAPNVEKNIVLAVLGITCPLAASAPTVINAAIDALMHLQTKDKKVKLILTLPKYNGKEYASLKLAGLQCLIPVLKTKGIGDTYAWYAEDGNDHCAKALEALEKNISDVVWLTDTAHQGILDNNVPVVLSTGSVNPKDSKYIVKDTTVADMEEIEKNLNSIVETANKMVEKNKLNSRQKQALHKFLEAHNNEPKVKNVLSFIKTDFGGKSTVECVKKTAKDRKEKAKNAVKNADNIGNEADKAAIVAQVTADFLSSYETLAVSTVTDRQAMDQTSQEGGGGMFAGMKIGGGGKSISSTMKDPKDPKGKVEKESATYLDYIAYCFSGDGKNVRPEFIAAENHVWEALEFEEIETESTAKKEEPKEDSKDKSKEENPEDSKKTETGEAATPEESNTDEESADEQGDK